jgi:oligoribonuclease NrnB/cAMP/cGMP phosphodiesterase (DHH superfamily)
MPDPTLCIYHAPCSDGFGAAWAVWKQFGHAVRFHPGVHGEPPPDVTGEHVVLVDFSYKFPVLLQMAAQATSITVLDHHKTAELDLKPLLKNGYIDGVFDMTRSGAVITWEYYHPMEPVPELLRHVQDRDLWQFKLPHTREIQAAVFSYEYSFDAWSALDAECRIDKINLIKEGAAIERKHHKDIAELLKVSTRSMVIGGVKVPVANLPYTMASDAAHILAQDAPFAACYFDRAETRIFSLRSAETGADVSTIAAAYGGGGHVHASGFQISLDELSESGLL